MGDWEPAREFPGELFAARRAKVLDSLGAGAMLLPAAPILHRTGDTELRYRPDSELYYLTGFTEPEALLLLRGFATEDRTILFVRPRDQLAELWTGPRAGPEGARIATGVEGARSIETLGANLSALLRGADRIHYRLGQSPTLEPAILDALREARLRGARTGTGPRGILDPGEILDELRLRKDPHEVEAMRRAADITVAGARAGIRKVRPGVGEWEIEAEVEWEFRRRGASGPSFATIAGSGANACVLHYIENSRRMEAGELLLLDTGAEWGLYSGDITRTVPVSGRFSPEQLAIYEIVEAARREVVDMIAPGVRTDALHLRALQVISEGLIELRLLSGSIESILADRSYERYFPHRTSHWLGLNTHDVGDYAREGTPRPLEPGMVLTVEPGLYSPPGDGTPFAGIGIRIEDDVLVTERGREVLTGALPTAPSEVEALVGTAKSEGVDVRR